jgi:hypothetical protein
MKLNNKGFTLFTALISLILVSISLALVFNMIATEETYLDLIQDQASMSDLITMGDLAKADAFNTFLISLRSKWEESKSNPSNSFQMQRKHIDMNWTEFTDDFVKDTFFERNFAGYFAQSLLYNLEYKQNPPGYAITIKKDVGYLDEDGEYHDNDNFNEIIEQIFRDGGQEVKVVDCNQDSDDCVGSFYLTLDTTKLSDENYEMLPIITVLRYKTNQVIQRPILNRQVYKIYMPWRGFQAFRVVRRIALGAAEKEDFPAISEQYTGLFNPKLHNTLEQARLGYCDSGTCSPRPNFFQTPTTKGFDSKCNLVPPTSFSGPLPSILNGASLPENYDSKDVSNMKEQFNTFYEAVLNHQLQSLSGAAYPNTGLIMEGNTHGDLNFMEIKAEAEGKEKTKKIIEQETVSGINIGDYPSTTFSALQDISGIAGGIGIYLNDNKSSYIWDEYNTWYLQHNNKSVGANSSAASINFTCVELRETVLYFRFIETDPRYYVRENYTNNGITTPVSINVELRDEYTPFFFPNSTTFWQGLTAVDGYVSGTPPDLEGDFENKWTCYTKADGDGAKCGVVE